MITGKTSSGFEFRVSENIKSDYRFVKCMRKALSSNQNEQIIGTVDAVSLVFNDDAQEDAFLAHLAGEDGRVPTERVFAELKEILDASEAVDKDVKN